MPIRIVVALTFALLAITSSASVKLACDSCTGITIASWNAENLGPTKLDDGRAERIAQFIAHHDVIIIQEITDASGRTPSFLCTYLENHTCIVSERTGTTRKEQYLIASRLPIGSAILIEHPELERGVYSVQIDLGYRNLTIATAHLKPDRVPDELRAIEPLLGPSTILVGDLNADCSYLPEGSSPYLKDMHWIIPDAEDTTPARSRCAYDRFVASTDALGLIAGYRIEPTPHDLSDHHAIVLILS